MNLQLFLIKIPHFDFQKVILRNEVVVEDVQRLWGLIFFERIHLRNYEISWVLAQTHLILCFVHNLISVSDLHLCAKKRLYRILRRVQHKVNVFIYFTRRTKTPTTRFLGILFPSLDHSLGISTATSFCQSHSINNVVRLDLLGKLILSKDAHINSLGADISQTAERHAINEDKLVSVGKLETLHGVIADVPLGVHLNQNQAVRFSDDLQLHTLQVGNFHYLVSVPIVVPENLMLFMKIVSHELHDCVL